MLSDTSIAEQEIPAAVNYRGRRISRPSGLERRQQIIDATLRIIVRDGMRGVRHRAVAAEAGVPLAATTYYFRDIEDLITAAFLDWARRNAAYSDKFRGDCFRCVEEAVGAADAGDAARQKLIKSIVVLATNYIIEQVTSHRENRIIELAFQHEAYGNEKLKSVVLQQHDVFLQNLEMFHRAVNSADPVSDAWITYGLMLRIEQDLFMRGYAAESKELISTIIRRHIEAILNVKCD